MFVQGNMDVGQNGNLTIGGQDAVELAGRYGTPLYVMDEDIIRENCAAFRQSMETYYGGKGLVAYASKAFSCKEIYRIVGDEGLGIDVGSTRPRCFSTGTTRRWRNCAMRWNAAWGIWWWITWRSWKL